jgi:hypothetical protein
MKYLEALNKRGLSAEKLPKALQNKIKDLELQVSAYNELNENEDLSESDLEEIALIKNSIDELDNHVAHKVNIFDQTKYDAKLDNISKMKKARQSSKVVEEVVPKEKVVKEVEAPKVQEQPKQVQVQQQPQQPQVSQNLHSGYDEVYEQEEEFEKVAEGKPKKITTGLILMGVGAFFLTWGAVNFFKSRK